MCPKSLGFKQVIHQSRSSCSFFRNPLDIREEAANIMAGKYITTSPEMRLQIQKSKSFTFLKVGNSRLSVISQLKAAGGIQQTGHLRSLEVELYIHHSFNCERNQSSNRMLNVSKYISFSDVRHWPLRVIEGINTALESFPKRKRAEVEHQNVVTCERHGSSWRGQRVLELLAMSHVHSLAQYVQDEESHRKHDDVRQKMTAALRVR